MAPEPLRVRSWNPEAEAALVADNLMWRTETDKDIRRAVKNAVAKEREACARIIDATYMEEAAAQIRARR